MSRLEVGATVSAVVATFHCGAELMQRIKKRHRRRKGKQAYEEDQLEEALQRGEIQIQERFEADCRELGPIFRVGDSIAYDRLQHIAVMMQAEIIRSLQIAAEKENALLNLTVLYESSVVNRQDTIRTLEELKQRIQFGMSVHQPSPSGHSAGAFGERPSMDSAHTYMTAHTSSSSPSGLIPSAVTIPDAPEPKTGLSRLLSRSERSDKNDRSRKQFSLAEACVPAFAASDWLRSSTPSSTPSFTPSFIPSTAPPSTPYPIQPPPISMPLPSIPANMSLPPPVVPEFPQNMPPYPTADFLMNFQGLQLDDRLHARQDSVQDNAAQYLSKPTIDLNYASARGFGRHPSTSTSSGRSDNASASPVLGEPTVSQRSSAAYLDSYSSGTVSPIGRPINPDQIYRAYQVGNSPASRSAPPPIPASRTSSISGSSQRSSVIFTPTSTNAAMLGRPRKENNYWGFCKGSWAIREGIKKGISLQTRPNGMYSNLTVWGCKHCAFHGDVFHNVRGKKPKEQIIDPRLHVSGSGIRYFWIFLAKSHVKKKATAEAGNSANYGCLFCCAEGKGTGIFGNVDTLMNHIIGDHSSGMTAEIQERTKCVWGRDPLPGEEYDIHIPPKAYELSAIQGSSSMVPAPLEMSGAAGKSAIQATT